MKVVKIIFTVLMIAVLAAFTVSCASSGGGGGGSGARWTFEDPGAGTNGWELATGENYRYTGTLKLSRDEETFGKGLLRLDVDFTNEKTYEWSEPKMKIDFPRSVKMNGITRFAFDFYYNPSFATTPDASFKAKVFSNNGGFTIDYTGETIEGGEDVGNGFLMKRAQVLIVPTPGFIPDMRFSIAGYLTDYKGPIFFDNMAWE